MYSRNDPLRSRFKMASVGARWSKFVQLHLGYPVCEHNIILCRYAGTSAQAPSVIMALERERFVASCKGIQDSLGFWILGTGFRILCQRNLDPGFQSLGGIPDSKAQDSTSKNFLDSKILILLHERTYDVLKNFNLFSQRFS